LKRLRHFVAETVGELKEAIKDISEETLITKGTPYNFLLIEQYDSNDEHIGIYIKISEFIDGVSIVNDYVCCENKWFEN